MTERVDELVRLLDAPEREAGRSPLVAELARMLDAPEPARIPFWTRQEMERKMAEARARPPGQILPSAMEMVGQLYDEGRAKLFGETGPTVEDMVGGIPEPMRVRAAEILEERPWMMPAGAAEGTTKGQFFGRGRIGPTLALWRNLFYGVGRGLKAGASGLGLLSPEEAEAWEAELEKTFFENLERGLKRWGQASHRNALWLAKKASFGNKSIEEPIYRAVRQGPEVLAAIIGQPGLLETKQVVPYAEPETFIGKGAGLIGDAAEFFGGLHGLGKLTGSPQGLSGLAKRGLMAAIVSETQHDVPSAGRFASNAAIYFALIGTSEKVRVALERALKGSPVGAWLDQLNAGSNLNRAFASTLDKGGAAAKYLIVDRADDWMESVFDSLYYAWRARPAETSFLGAFLGGLPVSLAVNYLTESVGDLPGMARMGMNGRAMKKTERERIEAIREGAGTAYNAVSDVAKELGIEGTPEELAAAQQMRDLLSDPQAFRRAVKKGEIVRDDIRAVLTPYLARIEAELARRRAEPTVLEQPEVLEQAAPDAQAEHAARLAALASAKSPSRADVAEALGVEPNALPPDLRTVDQRHAMVANAKRGLRPLEQARRAKVLDPEPGVPEREVLEPVQGAVIPDVPAPRKLAKPKRVQRMEASIEALRLEITRLEHVPKEPGERQAIRELREQLKVLTEAHEAIAVAPAKYTQEMDAESPYQLAAEVQKRGKKRSSGEERNAARVIRDAGKRIGAIRERYTAELRDVGDTPILDYLKGGRGEPLRQIWWDPKLHPEVRDWLQGKDVSVRRYFTRTEKPTAQSLDGIADELKTRNIFPADLHETAVLAALDREFARPRTWEDLLRVRGDEEAALIEQAEETGQETLIGIVGYASDLERLEAAYRAMNRAADFLREGRVKQMALAGMPYAENAAELLRGEIQKMETIATRAGAAKEIAIQQELARLRQELSGLERELAEQGQLPELRRYIAQQAAIKGVSKKGLGDIVAKVAGVAYTDAGGQLKMRRTTRAIMEKGTLLKVLEAIERVRAKRIGGKDVITAKRERQIQKLRENLIAEDSLTDDDFIRQLRELRIVEPRYVDARHFITQQQGRKLIDKMIAERPIIARRQATLQALAENPQMAAVVEKLETAARRQREALADRGKKLVPNVWVDFRYYLAGMQDGTGASFYDAGMAMVFGKREAELAVIMDFDAIAESVGADAYKRIARDPVALERVNDWIASKLKRAGAPPAPTDITPDEVRMAQAVEIVLAAQRNQVRWERFIRWRFEAKDIPNAPKRELNRADDIYNTQGPEAARAYLDGLAWGVIGSGFEPESVVMPKIHHGPQPPMRYGDRGIEAREAVFQRQEKNILMRLHSYLFRRYQATYVTPRIRTFVTLWDAQADKFENPHLVARQLGFAIAEVSGAPATAEPLARIIRRVYSHALLAKVLIDPAKSLRNVCQTMAFYTDRSDLFRPGIAQAVTTEDWQYYKDYVSQLGGLRRDYFMEQEKPFVLERWVRIARTIAPYRWSDEYPRRWCYAAKLARVDRALKAHPNDVGRMLDAAAIDDLDTRQIQVAVETLARDGEAAFKRFVAHQITDNVHFVYGREQRALVEMSDTGRTWGNLLTFPRSYTQRVAKNVAKVYRGRTLRERWRGLKTVLSIIVGGWFVGEGYRRLYGQRRNPYNALQILNWSAGGLMMGGVDVISDLIWQTEEAVMGTPGALDRASRAFTQVPAMFLPLYAEVLDAVEGVSGTRNLDLYALRRLRQRFSSTYKPRSPKVQRTAVETWQKILTGGADQPLADLGTLEAVELARTQGLDVRKITGTLRDGRVGVKDVEKAMKRRFYQSP